MMAEGSERTEGGLGEGPEGKYKNDLHYIINKIIQSKYLVRGLSHKPDSSPVWDRMMGGIPLTSPSQLRNLAAIRLHVNYEYCYYSSLQNDVWNYNY